MDIHCKLKCCSFSQSLVTHHSGYVLHSTTQQLATQNSTNLMYVSTHPLHLYSHVPCKEVLNKLHTFYILEVQYSHLSSSSRNVGIHSPLPMTFSCFHVNKRFKKNCLDLDSTGQTCGILSNSYEKIMLHAT